MGLDITAYRRLTKIDALFDADGEPVDQATREPLENYFKAYANPYFPGRAQGIEDRGVYKYEEAEDVFSLSYGGYNRWREVLANLAGYPLAAQTPLYGDTRMLHAAACWNGATGPFSELINFADNEGVIGPVVAAKLALDFAEFEERAKGVSEPYFYDKYCDMRRGVEMAADGGALDFH